MSERELMQPVPASRLAELEAATAEYEAAVSEDAAFWLEMRGIGAAERRTFRLGVVGTDPHPGHERARGNLVIPYLSAAGEPLALRFRCLRPGCPHEGHGKYMSLPGEPVRMFNVGAIHRADDELHITEGELDSIILTKIGLPAVAIPGALNWKAHHRRMVAGFSRVYVWGDPDEAGSDFANKVASSVRNARRIRLRKSDGDINDLYLNGGESAVRERLEEAV